MLRSQLTRRSRVITMKANQFSRSLRLALTGAVLTCGATVAFADIKDYEFELVEPTVKAGPDKIIAVRLVNKTTGKPVPDAVIFATRLDMAPDAMQEMATKSSRCRERSPAPTSSRPRSAWPAAGSFRSAPRCRAKPARSKTSSSSQARNEAVGSGRNRRCRHGCGDRRRPLASISLAERSDEARTRHGAGARRTGRCRSTIRTRTASRSIR